MKLKSPYAKAIVAAAASLAVLGKAVGDLEVSPQEAIEVVLAALAALGVYAVPNDEQ